MDISLLEVRKYIEEAIDFFIKESGLEGIKLDFWSYAFEDCLLLRKEKKQSGYQWRD
ncbi:MAG: hypothetical protein NC922_02000 [Candidatus Omnitrophica bacterium]|nr:hypothetical protein [Candidatus Omnitrophota bacterium]